MEFILHNAGKNFGNEWIFRNLNLKITQGEKLAILGKNGSGKSTLLQVLAGYISLSEGKLDLHTAEFVKPEELFKTISFASPYLQLPEELRLHEAITHLARFKPFREKLTTQSIIEISGLSRSRDKLISQFSSGMKQRLKIALALFANSSVVLLDEPLSHLDSEGYTWFQKLVNEYS